MSRFFRQLKRSLMSLQATEYAKLTGKRDWKYVRTELYCSFLDTFIYSWLDPIRRFGEFLERCFAYLPLLWVDRDWDHAFLLNMMSFKIKRMKELHIRCKRHVGVEKTIKQLLTCEQLLDRMSKDEYTDKSYHDHNQKWFGGKCILDRLNDPKDPKESKEFRRIMDHGEYMYQQDVDMFCKIFKKYHRRWWD